MEFVAGVKVNDREALEAAGIEYSDLMVRLMRIFNRMILAHGFSRRPTPWKHPREPQPARKGVVHAADFGLAKDSRRVSTSAFSN
jgi:hypothetical protein